MSVNPRILVVAATEHELAKPDGWLAIACGVGPIEAAAGTAAAIAQLQPHIVLHVGIAGARRARALAPASLVIGRASLYCDADATKNWSPHSISAPQNLMAIVHGALRDAELLTIGTSARVGGTTACDVEAMEGFGVLRAAERANIPALEVRAISNEIEEDDRRNWHFAAAFSAITAATPLMVHALRAHLINGISTASHA